ncbi:MAG: DmsC/YnfH family molybdoenzyme membrane anchor subunit [Acidobacteriota bacterium]
MAKGFKIDLNKCVGCHACVVACSIENGLEPGESWRSVHTYNRGEVSDIPHFHLSLSCNHCSDAPCIKQCPAKAISRNSDTGIIEIDELKCVGCKFCTWVCPYDAPKYKEQAGVMGKCTMCSHRVSEDLEPACVSVCPTGALEFEEIEDQVINPDIPGFPQRGLSPALKIKDVDPSRLYPEQYVNPYPDELLKLYGSSVDDTSSKISLKKEWVLLVFTLMFTILGGLLSSAVFKGVQLEPLLFGIAGIGGMALSSVHLGKKFRSFRSIFNLGSSWLSREIFFYSVFIGSSLLYLFFPDMKAAGYSAVFFSLISAYSIDMLYHSTASENPELFHSSQITLSLLFLIFYLNNFIFGFTFIAVLKVTLYIKRHIRREARPLKYLFLPFLRILFLALPVVLIFIPSPWFPVLSMVFFTLGEIIDRSEFYIELDIITPEKDMEKKFQIALKKK